MSEPKRYKYPLQLPESLKNVATRLAKEDGVSLNQWIVAAVAQKVGAVETASDFLSRRAEGANHKAVLDLLDQVPDVEPAEEDKV